MNVTAFGVVIVNNSIRITLQFNHKQTQDKLN